MKLTFEDVREKALEFRRVRDWEQFHFPKNLAEGVSIEAGELLENFLWKTCEESRNLSDKELKNLREEVGDIFLFLVYMCEEFKIDLMTAASEKIDINEKKYPAHKARGNRQKYTEYEQGQ
jgi:dCTP diphosphatase